MKWLIIFITSVFSIPSYGQQTNTLKQCYDLAKVNYPLAKQSQLLETQNRLDEEVLATGNLPKLSFDAQATYQSDVIKIPIPNSAIAPLNKDQYRATLSVNQLIYNGGVTDASVNLKSAQTKTKLKQVEVNLYQLKQKINNLYFSILLTRETRLLLEAKQKLIQAKLSEVKAGIKNGALIPTSDIVLEAELLKIKQQFIDIESSRLVLIETLSSIIGQTLNTATVFQTPVVQVSLQPDLTRPELDLFKLTKEEISRKEALVAKQNLPRLFGFATGGYGNPGLNMLDNSFQPFYIVGIKLNWNVFDWNANKKNRESLVINNNLVDTETQTFRLNTNNELNQQRQEIEKIAEFMTSDLKIIELRKEVLKSADSQLKNGVITSSAYLVEVTNLYEDENTLVKHEIQLQLAKANYNSIKGE